MSPGGDGASDPRDVRTLVAAYEQGYTFVLGARTAELRSVELDGSDERREAMATAEELKKQLSQQQSRPLPLRFAGAAARIEAMLATTALRI